MSRGDHPVEATRARRPLVVLGAIALVIGAITTIAMIWVVLHPHVEVHQHPSAHVIDAIPLAGGRRIVLVPRNTEDHDGGELRRLETDGRIAWRVPIWSTSRPLEQIGSHVLLRAVFDEGGSPMLRSFDLDDGSLAWSSSDGLPFDPRDEDVIAVGDDSVFALSWGTLESGETGVRMRMRSIGDGTMRFDVAGPTIGYWDDWTASSFAGRVFLRGWLSGLVLEVDARTGAMRELTPAGAIRSCFTERDLVTVDALGVVARRSLEEGALVPFGHVPVGGIDCGRDGDRLFVAWESDDVLDPGAAAIAPLVLTPTANGVVPDGATGALFMLDDHGLRAAVHSNWGTPRIRDGDHGPDVPWAALHLPDGTLGAHVIAYPSSDAYGGDEPLGWETRLALDAETLAVIHESPRTSFTWEDL